ncbi:MAG: hypothetical protein HOV81_15115 [Kofleriaceae bacterium]|nr:hypothetical protein [Kofleriaceae bacterium]
MLLVAACTSSTGGVQAPRSAPAADATARCPVGDGVNVSVYTFLVREMAERTTASRDATRAAVADEAKTLADPSLKPPRASVIESEVSHVLTTLCEGTPGCITAAIYDRGGLAIALSSVRSKVAPYGIADDARWNQVTASSIAESGAVFDLACDEAKAATLPCTRDYRLVAFPVFDNATLLGLASCIVER